MLAYLVGRMKRNLRDKLRRWLFDDSGEGEKPSLVIDCIIPGSGHQKFVVTGIAGLRLVGKPADGKTSGVRLIGETEAVDKSQFWELIRSHLGDAKLTWEDGTEFRP